MMATADILRPALAAAALLLFGGCDARDAPVAEQKAAPANVAVAAPAFPPPRSLVPFVKHKELDCNWDMEDVPREKWIRGGIERGDEDPMISFVDHAFDDWSESGRHNIEVSVGDPKHRLPASVWVSKGSEPPGIAGFYMDAKMRRLIGGATSLQIWKDGTPVFNTLLAGTPSTAELDACIQKPGWDVDSEYDHEREE